MKRFIKFTSLVLMYALVWACKDNGRETVEIEIPQIVIAYTGGIVSDGVPVRIEFNVPIEGVQAGAKADSKLFSFSPSLKGFARWTGNDAIEFYPDGGYKPGVNYKATFDIGKARGTKEKKFEFNFYSSPKEASITPIGVQIKEYEPGKAAVLARVVFSENITKEQAEEMISISVKGKKTGFSVKAESGNSFLVTSDPVEMEDKPLKADIGIGGNFKSISHEDVIIPSVGDFSVVSAELHRDNDAYIEVIFSRPLSSADDYTGLIYAQNAGRNILNIEGNIAKLYIENPGNPELIVSQNIKDYSGELILGHEYRLLFNSTEFKPAIELPFNSNILPDAANLVLPFRSVNLSAVDLSVIKIYSNNVLSFLQENSIDGSRNLRRTGRKIYKKTIRLDTGRDLHSWQDFSIDLSNLIKDDKGAVYRIKLSFRQEYSLYGKFFTVDSGSSMISTASGDLTAEEIAEWDEPSPYYYESAYDWSLYNWKDKDNPDKPSYYMEDSRFKEINLLYSNIGLTAKYADGNTLWATVTDIISAQALSGADITVYNYQLQKIGEGISDKNGMASIKVDGKPFVLTASIGDVTGYLKVNDGYENSLSRFDTGGCKVTAGIKGYAYGERGVWRPGDTLHLSLIVNDKGNRLPENHPVKLDIYTPSGQFYSSQINSKGRDGLYAFAVPTQADDPTGKWNAYFKVGGATVHKALNIETIKPNRLKIELKTGDAVISAGKATDFTVNSEWLTGATAYGLDAVVDMTLRKGKTTFKGYEKYIFDSPVPDFSFSETSIIKGKLDRNGSLSVSCTMPKAQNAPGMLSADFLTRVSEPGGDESFILTSIPFSPYKSYVGLQVPETEDGVLETDKNYSFNVAAVDQTGQAITGDKIEYRIYKLKWSWWWESRSESLDSYVNGTAGEPVVTGSFTAGGKNSFDFKINYPEWGRYFVFVKNMTSGHSTGTVVYVDYPSWRGRADRTDPDGLTMLSFSMDKKKYKVGEKATVYIPAAENGRALVSLENSSTVLSRTWVNTGSSETPYSFRITEDMAPNIYVHITLLQPHRNSANDLPIRMYGVQPVMVYNPETVLEPVLKMPDVLRPQEEFEVKVSEKNGKAMSYTLAIVDEGLLDITAFKTPDPWTSMYAREALGVKTWDMFDNVVGAFSGKFSPMFSIGGDGELIKSGKRDNRFNPVVKFIGPFRIPAKGSKTHKITLPMYVGSVRAMIVASGENAYGSTEKTVPVRSPLMILPTAPRVLGTNEQCAIPVNVFAMEDEVKDVNVQISVKGAARIVSKSVISLKFDEVSDRMATFSINTSDVEGPVEITVRATSGVHTAEDKINLTVRNPEPSVSRVYAKTIEAGKTASFEYDSFKAKNGDEWAKLTLAAFPTIDVGKCFEFVGSYEHACSEQISSKGLILLGLSDLASEEQKETIKKSIPMLVQTLCTRQLADGGFPYWASNSSSNEWVSSMAGHFLKEAAMAGYSVSPAVLKAWENYQKRCIRNYRGNSGNFSDFVQAYRLYTLAVYGNADSGAMNRLKEEPSLSTQAKWCLAAAYCIAGKKATAQQLLDGVKPEYSNSEELVAYTYGSDLRDKAMYLETMVLLGNIPDAVILARELADEFSYEYMSTQSTAFAAMAIGRLAKATGISAIQASINEAGTTTEAVSPKAYCEYNLNPENGKVSITNNAKSGSVTAILTTRHRGRAGSTQAASKGLALSVKYTDANGNTINPGAVGQGTDIFASITVTNTGGQPCNNLALTVGAPSGWKLFNERLTGNDTKQYANTDIRDDKAIFYFSLAPGKSKVIEQRFHASYCGSFALPAIRCEDMYKPSVYACTASSRANVLSAKQ